MVDQDLALINISRVPWRLLDTLKELKIKWVEVHHADNPRVANVPRGAAGQGPPRHQQRRRHRRAPRRSRGRGGAHRLQRVPEERRGHPLLDGAAHPRPRLTPRWAARSPERNSRPPPGRDAVDLSATINLLGEMLGEVLRAQESTALFETEERIRALAKSRRAGETAAAKRLAEVVAALPVETARATASAFAVYFDLVNLAEEGHRIQALRAREQALHPAPIGESIGEAVELLKSRGFTSEQMAALLDRLRVELVLTAHPTEAKRRTILSKLQRVSEVLRAPARSRSAPARARGRDRDAARRDHRALAHQSRPHHASGRDRRGAHRALLRGCGLLGHRCPAVTATSSARCTALPGARAPAPLAHARLVDRRRP